MTHFGIFCPPVSSHVSCFAALGSELLHRNHRVTFFNILDVESRILNMGFEFVAIAPEESPLGTLEKYLETMGRLSGLKAINWGIQASCQDVALTCKYAPDLLKEAGVEAVLADQGSPAGSTVAEYLKLPYINLCCGIPLNREEYVSPWFVPWSYNPNPFTAWRNKVAYSLFDWLTRDIKKTLNQFRCQWGLLPYSIIDESFSPLAQIAQGIPELDFPRSKLSDSFHYIGAWQSSSSSTIPFPYEKLDGRPIIYASLGTMQNRQKDIFTVIAAACQNLDGQLVITLGGAGEVSDLEDLPGSPLVVKYAPQQELLKRTSLTITHGGINTVLESLDCGVPMVVIPIANDQPGMGARVEQAGVGKVVPLNQLNVSKLKTAIEEVWGQNTYTEKAKQMGTLVAQAGGVQKAADIVEQVIG